MFRHLRQVLAHERGVREPAIRDLRLIVEITAREPQRLTETVFDVALHAPDARLAKVLLLRRGRVQRHVRHRIFDPVVIPGDASRQIADGRHVDTGFAADQPLGAQLIVGAGRDRPDGKLTVQLGKGRRSESGVDRRPPRHLVRQVIERRDARTEHGIVPFGNRVAIVGRRQPGRHGGFEVVTVVILPMIRARAQGEHQLRHRRVDVRDEGPQALLGAAGDPLHRKRGGLGHTDDRGRHRGDVGAFPAVAVDPSHVRAGAEHVLGAEDLGPLQHAADPLGRDQLIGGQTHDVARRGGVGHREEVVVRVLIVDKHMSLKVALIRAAALGCRRSRWSSRYC